MMMDFPRNAEFADAWDDLKPRLEERGFNLEAYLEEKAKVLSVETIERLRIAACLGRMLHMSAEYERWKQEEEAKEYRQERLRASFRRSGWVAVAAALILFAVFLAPHTAPPQEKSFRRVFDSFALMTAVSAAERNLNLPASVSPAENFKRITAGGNFKYGDVDSDGALDIVLADGGYVFCFGLDGQKKWEPFKLTQDCFDPEFLEKLKISAQYLRNDSLHPNQPASYRAEWGWLPEDPSADPEFLNKAWNPLKNDIQITDICNFDDDPENEVLITLFGGVIVLDHNGQQKTLEIDGHPAKQIILLDGSIDDLPNEIYDIDGDGKLEFLVYRMSSFPMTYDGKRLYGNLPNPWDLYVYNEEIDNARGIYVASHEGKESWHLNLPYHCRNINVGDWNGDGKPELTLDLYLPENGYVVDYSDEFKSKVALNFDWSTFPWSSFPRGFTKLMDWNMDPDIQPDPRTWSLAFIAMSMRDGQGRIEYFQPINGSANFLFFCSRFLGEDAGSQLDCMEYYIEWDKDLKNHTGNYWYVPWKYDSQQGRLVQLSKVEGGYPDLWDFTTGGLFGFDTPEGPRRVFGRSPLSEIVLTDENYGEVALYRFNPQKNDRLIPWTRHSGDAVVFDVNDLDGDGSKEILAGFGCFNPGGDLEQPLYSAIKILTADLKPFHPELGWDTFVVQGPISEAKFKDLDGDHQMDILILADYAYFITPQK
jgi:hypothetical protein